MQRQFIEFSGVAPAHVVALPVGGAGVHLAVRAGEHSRVAPAAVLDHGQPARLDRALVDAGFLGRLAQRGVDDVLVAVPRTARQAPRAAFVRAQGPML